MKILCFLFLFLFLFTEISFAKDYYVATTGNDGNSGKTLELAFRTIARGSNELSAGDTLYIKAGTYIEGMVNNSSKKGGYTFLFVNGKPDQYTRYSAYPGDERKVIIRSNAGKKQYGVLLDRTNAYIELNGLVLDGTDVEYSPLRLDGTYRYELAYDR